MTTRTVAAVLASAALAACATTSNRSAALLTALDDIVGDVPGPIHYFAAETDLNDDGRDEWVVYVAGPMVCGSGGCSTYVFSPGASGALQLVGATTVSRPPVNAARETTGGWRDLLVSVSGGGILPGHVARLRFDAATGTYPPNASMAPSVPAGEGAAGELLVGEFGSFTEGMPLRPAGN